MSPRTRQMASKKRAKKVSTESRPIRKTRNKAPAYVFSSHYPFSPSANETVEVINPPPIGRKPKLTPHRMNIIRGFLLNCRLYPEKYGKVGSKLWVEHLIRKLDEEGDCRISQTGLQAWLKTPLFAKMIKDLKRWEDEVPSSDNDSLSKTPSPEISPVGSPSSGESLYSPNVTTPPESPLAENIQTSLPLECASEGSAPMDTTAAAATADDDTCALNDSVQVILQRLTPMDSSHKKPVFKIGTMEGQPSTSTTNTQEINSNAGNGSLSSNDTVSTRNPCPPLPNGNSPENAENLIEQPQRRDTRASQNANNTVEDIREALQDLERQTGQQLATHNRLLGLGFAGFGMDMLGIQLTGLGAVVNHLLNYLN